ncbi:alkaline phosphatase, tissue-nonspecific isozyme-like [Thrips palmi]|uniref:alkaline phosphatase n=1 Tax=Thrips palmi TaxID=161013 RepID=A0A6P9AEW7_THRPL|nr:alkaline phosphatase, tissue-nonspecific isozyme-like [Thrips palmi]
MWRSFLLLGAAALLLSQSRAEKVKDRTFWYAEARAKLRQRLHSGSSTLPRPLPHAKNVILLVGDGMGTATVTAARILRGQRQGKHGEEAELAWDHFPTVGLVKTYNADAQVGESSACATALMCGVKANFETVGMDARGRFENCATTFNSKVPSLLTWAQQEGKATGVVTTTRITHATPAALYATAASRYWEDDGKVPPSSRRVCKDIARQLAEEEPGRNLNVALGGGRRHFLPKATKDPEAPNEEGRRQDGRNLVDEWLKDKSRRGLRAQYAWSKSQLQTAASAPGITHLLGLFAYSHMDFEADRDAGPDGDPSLADMTRAALAVLMRQPRGFFLFIEGGRIDHAHHYNNAYRALDETLALESALLAAMELVDVTDTLIVLTADHSHVLTLGGLATPRGNPILGVDSKVSDVDGMPYSTLLYGNGPGYSAPRAVPPNRTRDSGHPMSMGRAPPVPEDEEARNRVHGSAVPRQWATHGGEDVAVYSQGPLAHALLGGSMDQTFIPHAIAYIACLADFAERCRSGKDNYTTPPRIQDHMCGGPELGKVAPPGSMQPGPQPEVVASSVVADDGTKKKANVQATITANVSAPSIGNSYHYQVGILLYLCISALHFLSEKDSY